MRLWHLWLAELVKVGLCIRVGERGPWIEVEQIQPIYRRQMIVKTTNNYKYTTTVLATGHFDHSVCICVSEHTQEGFT